MPRTPFKTVLKAARDRKGGPRKLEAMLPVPPASPAKLRGLKDDMVLSTLSKGVFRAGFNWKVVENRWPDIEAAVRGFDPEHLAGYGSEELEGYLKEPGVIKNRSRMQACVENARWLLDVRGEHGSFGKYIANWPTSDLVGLYDDMKKRGSRLGGNTAQYVLRWMGKDTYIYSKSVVAALIKHGVVDKNPTGKGAQQKVQDAFNAWTEETGRPMCALSRILAYSVPD